VNLYGTYMGTDKIGHFLQQGREYYHAYRAEERRSQNMAAALQRAVRKGMGQERGILGRWATGVYSNADLATNYAGLKFYLNLTRTIQVGTVKRPPIVVLEDNHWKLNPDGENDVIRFFISDHFNEAMNPALCTKNLRKSVRKQVRERRKAWLEFYHTTAEQEDQRLQRLSTWHGEPYGHSKFHGVITIGNTGQTDTK